MAKPRGLFRRGNVWWVRKDVPEKLRPIIGVTSRQYTLDTTDLREAIIRYHPMMAKIEKEFDDARRKLNGEAPAVDQPLIIRALGFDDQPVKMRKSTKTPISLAEMFDKWVYEKKPTPNTEAEYRKAINDFIILNGKEPIAEYTVEHARAWKERVLKMPRAQATMEKHFGAVGTIFRFADRNDYLDQNPFKKVQLERPKRAKVSRRQEWDIADLQKLFDTPVFKEGKRFSYGDASFWLPVLSLFHGSRAGELCQLDRADVVNKNGVWCLALTLTSEDDENGSEKSLKTEESERIVPIHKRVLELGFLEYVRSSNAKKLFPHITPDSRGRWSGKFSKWFGRYRKKHGLGERWRDFHSLRHTWKSAARGARIPEDMHDAISGHDNASVGRSYGRFPEPELKAHINKIKFDLRIPKWKSRSS